MNMKKLIFSAIAFFVLAVSLSFAQKSSVSSSSSTENEITERIEILLEEGVIKNNKEIYELSALLSQEKREELYDEYSRNRLKACLLNLPGFGIGSFKEQDRFGGFVQLSATIVGWTAVFGGAFLIMEAEDNDWGATNYNSSSYSYGSGYSYGTKNVEDATAKGLGEGLIFVGVCSLIGNTIFGITRPIFYTERHNRILKSSLRVVNKKSEATTVSSATYRHPFEVSFSPILDLTSQNYGMSARIQM